MERDWNRLKIWIVRKRMQGWSVAEICAHAKISRDMFYRWWNRYRKEGWAGLEERPRGRPKGSGIGNELRRKIVGLRKRYEWGPNKIEGYLKQRGFNVPHNRIYRVFCEEGLNNPITGSRRTWGRKRFEREHSNSLWQADFKLCEDDHWLISFQDDHSRFITGSTKMWNPTGEKAIQLLERSVKRFGVPTQVLTDQGTQFKPARGELSMFTEHCEGLGIHHITASKRRPTTNWEDRGLSQSIRKRGTSVQQTLDLRKILQLHPTTRSTKLFNPSNSILQRPESVRQFRDRTLENQNGNL